MGLRSHIATCWAAAPRALKRACCVGGLTALALGLVPARAVAQGVCPGTVSGSYTLSGDLTATTGDVGNGPCISIGADGTTVNLAGHTLDVSALGDTGVAIETGTTSNVSIIGSGGSIVTNYSTQAAETTAAIDSQGGQNITVTGVNVANKPGGQLCALYSGTNLNWGTGISLNSVTGATISSNTTECFQKGIVIANSAVPRRGTGMVSGNASANGLDGVTGNNWDLMLGGSNYRSAGIMLDNSSGWTVNGNTIDYNGSLDSSYRCVSAPPALISCSFGVQIINGSSNNNITNNTVYSNIGGGIYTGPSTSKNKILSNNAYNNGLDLWDDAPGHSNAWRKNTCGTANDGNVGPQKCPN